MSEPKNQEQAGAAGAFAAIAAGAHGERKRERLVEPHPEPLPDIVIAGDTLDPRGLFDAPLDPRDAASFDAAVASERQRHAPFLRHLAPRPRTARVVIPVTRSEWRLEPETAWTTVAIPHYGGPQGPARAWYRMQFDAGPDLLACGCIVARFRGVDYKAAVLCNGALVGVHEGFSRFWVTLRRPCQRLCSRGTAMG